MYLLEFVNLVRGAQGYDSLERLPATVDRKSSPLELAMGCRLEAGLMRLSTPTAAQAVSSATGLPVGFDRVTIALPSALGGHATALTEVRSSGAGHAHGTAQAV